MILQPFSIGAPNGRTSAECRDVTSSVGTTLMISRKRCWTPIAVQTARLCWPQLLRINHGRQACFGLVVQNHRELLQLVSIVPSLSQQRGFHVMLDVVIHASVGLTPLALRLGSQELPEDRRSSFARGASALFKTKFT